MNKFTNRERELIFRTAERLIVEGWSPRAAYRSARRAVKALRIAALDQALQQMEAAA